MPRRKNRVFLSGILSLLLTACASAIPATEKGQARAVSFYELQQAPESYAGQLLLIGGEVLAVKPKGEWIEIEILERPLGFRDKPQMDRPPRGRFFVLSTLQGLDRIKPGREITLVGEMRGSEVRPLEGMSYTYPVVMARYVHLWSGPLLPGGPDIGIEIGFQGSIGF